MLRATEASAGRAYPARTAGIPSNATHTANSGTEARVSRQIRVSGGMRSTSSLRSASKPPQATLDARTSSRAPRETDMKCRNHSRAGLGLDRLFSQTPTWLLLLEIELAVAGAQHVGAGADAGQAAVRTGHRHVVDPFVHDALQRREHRIVRADGHHVAARQVTHRGGVVGHDRGPQQVSPGDDPQT